MEENLNFETTIKSLEQIVQELEKGDLNLDESVKRFEDGMALSKKCTKILDEAEKKITTLITDGEDTKEENFTPMD